MVNIYVDGSFKPETSEGTYGVVIKGYDFKKEFSGSLGKVKDNNVAEYGAIIKGLGEAKKLGLSKTPVSIHTDSQVIFRQMLNLIPPPKGSEHGKWYRDAISMFKSFSRCMIDFIYSSGNPAHNLAKNAV